MAPIPLTVRLRVSDNVVFQEIGGQAVLLDADSGEYFALDEVGTRAWVLLAAGMTVQEARDLLLGEYDVSADQLTGDLVAVVDTLIANRLLTYLKS